MKDYLSLINNDFEVLVDGESMYPTFYPSERVRCHCVDENTLLHCGNIILFYNRNERRYILHRIIKKISLNSGGYYYLTKGDKNLVCDEYLVKHEDIRGVL